MAGGIWTRWWRGRSKCRRGGRCPPSRRGPRRRFPRTAARRKGKWSRTDDAGAGARGEPFGLLPPDQIGERKEAGRFVGPGGEADRRFGQEHRAEISPRVF